MRSHFVVFRPTILHLFSGVVEVEEPGLAEAFEPNHGIEALGVGVVGRSAGAAEVKDDPFGIGPEIQHLRRELTTLIDPDRLRSAGARLPPGAVKPADHVSDRTGSRPILHAGTTRRVAAGGGADVVMVRGRRMAQDEPPRTRIEGAGSRSTVIGRRVPDVRGDPDREVDAASPERSGQGPA
jgi:hypothetical protein